MTPLEIAICSLATLMGKRRGDIGEPWGVPTQTGPERCGEL